MSDKKGKATAIDTTVKAQLASMADDNARLRKENVALAAENKQLKQQNVQLSDVIATDLKADLMLKIKAKSDYQQADLERLDVEQLQQIDETLSRSKGAGFDTATFKSIRAGGDSSLGRTTVGSLYGKKRSEILAMGGDF